MSDRAALTPQPGQPRHLRLGPRALDIAIIGSARFGVGEPFVGGLESHTVTTARALQRAGHRVTVYAGPADQPAPSDIRVVPIIEHSPDFTDVARSDTQMTSSSERRVLDGYRRLLEALARSPRHDVIHNNSLHFLPVLYDAVLTIPMVHVLHCPPFEELSTAHLERLQRSSPADCGDVVSVSASLHHQWSGISTSVIPNGVEIPTLPPGPTTLRPDHAVWAGRIVAEKGPHLAIDAARAAGMSIALAGPVQGRAYFAGEVEPRLGDDAVWVGHVSHCRLQEMYRSAAVGVATPCWEEPFGLVSVEMLACGLPVAAFDRGALSDLVTEDVGSLATGPSVTHLAAAIQRARLRDRGRCAAVARRRFSADTMVERYVSAYREAIRRTVRVAGTRRQPSVGRLMPSLIADG